MQLDLLPGLVVLHDIFLALILLLAGVRVVSAHRYVTRSCLIMRVSKLDCGQQEKDDCRVAAEIR